MMKLFTKYFLFLLTFIVVVQANIPPLTSSYDLRSSEYGARYYESRKRGKDKIKSLPILTQNTYSIINSISQDY